MSQMGPFGDLGPCIISWGGTDITEADSAIFRCTFTSEFVYDAAHGSMPVDGVFTGMEPVEVEVPFTRTSYANLTTVLPGSTFSGSGYSGAVEVRSNRVGTTMYGDADELIVKRIVNGIADTDETKWLHVFKTYPIPNFEVQYDLNNQRVFTVTFKAFPDQDTNDQVWRIGDTIN